MIKKSKDWLIRLLGGFTKSEMENVLKALDKTVLEKVRFERSGRFEKIKTADVVMLNCRVDVKPMWITPWNDREVALDMLKHEFKSSLLDDLWRYADTAVEFSGKEQMARAEARIYVLTFK